MDAKFGIVSDYKTTLFNARSVKITISEIALQAGVSTGTVSRVINGHSTVAEATRSKVQSVMEQLGYTPDPVARELSMRSKHTIGIWVGAGENRLSPYFNVVWRALIREMQERAIQFIELPGDLSGWRRPLNAVLVFNSSHLEERLKLLKEKKLPAVLIGHAPEISCVAPDDIGGGRIAAEHLLALGHRRLLHLSVAGEAQWHLERAQGFRDCADTAGPEVNLAIVRGDASVLGGYRLMRDAWLTGQRPTGIFCATDEMALGAFGALQDLGIRVPEAASVLGFDGLASELQPGLASITQDIARIASEAVSLVLEAIEGSPSRQVTVPVSLDAGTSLAPAPN